MSEPTKLKFKEFQLSACKEKESGQCLFLSEDIFNILGMEVKFIDFIGFSEALSICFESEKDNELAFFIKNVVIDNSTIEEWKKRYSMSFHMFLQAFYSRKSVEESEIFQQSVFKECFLNGEIPELNEFSILEKPIASLPDFVFSDGKGKKAIGEMKKVVFIKSMVKQVKRYMEKENINFAFVIAPSISCDLPDNIKFIKYPR